MQESAARPIWLRTIQYDDPNLRDLLVFHNVARALTSSLDRDAILRAIMQQMEQFFKPETWSLLLLDEARKELYYAVAVGHTEADLAEMRVPGAKALRGGWRLTAKA